MSSPFSNSVGALEPPRFIPDRVGDDDEGGSSAVSWAAVLAGAVASAALALALLALGAGAGLSSLSPWSNAHLTPEAVGTGALIWLVIVELLASALGGYLAGRLRTKWTGVHDHEVYFRDTAHGFLAWATALVLTAAFLTSAASAMVGSDSRSMEASRDGGTEVTRYYVDRLFRSQQPMVLADSSIRAESGAVLMHALHARSLADDDRDYLAFAVATRTGLSRPDAATRVNATFTAAEESMDALRRAAAHGLYWLFVALLIGAFASSLAATTGGRRRDRGYHT